MKRIRTQVAIVGAGPAGLLLSHLLHLEGVESVVIEARDRAYVEARVRAGVLEQGTVDILRQTGVGERLDREGMRHTGMEMHFNGRRHRYALDELTGGKVVTVYGQQEVVKDLIARRLADQGQILFESSEASLHGFDGDTPEVRFTHGGEAYTLRADYIAGCDGFHGVARATVAHRLQIFDREYPFAWLGILAQAAPMQHEIVYANHPRGFALLSMRSPSITRAYVQCKPDENLDEWSDDRIWSELQARLATDEGPRLNEGPILQKGVTPMRSFVAAPMRHGRLFLAGDAAHIVPPTGAKGMNLAVSDVKVLSQGLVRACKSRDESGLDRYSEVSLRRIWRGERFSWHMTSMLHKFESQDAFGEQMQLAELDYYTGTDTGRRSIAENYVGLPIESV